MIALDCVRNMYAFVSIGGRESSNSTCMLKKLTIVSHQILLLVFFIDWFICISERIQYSDIELGRTFSIHLNCLLSK